jgi:hypothetical protein
MLQWSPRMRLLGTVLISALDMAKKSREWLDKIEEVEQPVQHCWLCERPIGDVTEWHHPIPKSRGGRERQPVHPICHRTIHANFTNSELERHYSTLQALHAHSEIERFIDWIANKPPNFNAPTKDRR